MLAVHPPVAPMLARLARALPDGDWRFEPKWDGFRCLAFRAGDRVELQSRNERPLTRYFPEVVAAVLALPGDVVLDGELLLADADDFPTLLARIHPAASRVARLAAEHPATFTAFDCLAVGDRDLRATAFDDRRGELERVTAGAGPVLTTTPTTRDRRHAQEWLDHPHGWWDGVVAKDPTSHYQPGQRVMVKVKHERTADCALAGVRVGAGGGVSSLLLGLWTPAGELHHPGVVSSPPRAVKVELGGELPELVVPLEEHPWRRGFGLEGGTTGRLKGAGGRWLPGMTQDWLPVRPVRVVEVAYDRLDGLRFRHPARFRHWRPDRDATDCSVDQLVITG